MTDRLDLFFRAHIVPVTPQKEYRSKRRATQPKDALIFRCAITGDEKKELLFGAYICAEWDGAEYVAKEICLFHREGHPEEFRVLMRFVKNSAYELGGLEGFRRNVFLKYLKARALIVAYDAPREISRIAIKWNKSAKTRRAFSFYFRMFRDKKTGKMRPSPYDPGVSIESIDAAKAIYRPIKYKFHDKDSEREEEEEEEEEEDKKFSTKDGGLIPCAGGPHQLAKYHEGSGNAAVMALSFAEVNRIRERFEALNPWRKTLMTPFLKLEKENFDANGERKQLMFYGTAAKLYCLFNLDGNRLVVRKPSGHGLGFLQAPYTIADWQRKTKRKWKEDLAPWIFETWHFALSRELGLPYKPPSWLKQPAVMSVPITTPQVWERLGVFKDQLRPFTVVTVPFPKRETVTDPLWTGYFIMPHTDKLNDLHGRTMVNIVTGETFHIYDKNSSRLPKPSGWLSLRTMEDEISRILDRTESKFSAPNRKPCTSKTVGLLARRYIVAGEFHYIGRDASTRWGGGPDPSMLADAGALDPADETCREYERVVDEKYLDQVRTEAKQFPNKLLSRQSGVARSAIMNFKKGRNTIKPLTLRKLTKAIHALQNKGVADTISHSIRLEHRFVVRPYHLERVPRSLFCKNRTTEVI